MLRLVFVRQPTLRRHAFATLICLAAGFLLSGWVR
jgi:hypothetical protein